MNAGPIPIAPDQTARDMALDVRRSFIVQAPAGSGKTGLLIQRYLALLAAVAEPEAILAITFTRKAAGEMRRRVLKALHSAADTAAVGMPPSDTFTATTQRLARQALEHSEKLGWRLLEHPSRIVISTIDAFNLSLVRRLPLLSRFGAEPKISDRPEHLYREAARRTLRGEGLEDGAYAPVAAVLEHLDGRYLEAETLLAAMLGARQQWLTLLSLGREDRHELEAALYRESMLYLKLAHAALTPYAARLVPLAARAAGNVNAEKLPNIVHLNGLERLPPPDPAALDLWRGLADLLLTKNNSWRKSIDKSLRFAPNDSNKAAFVALLAELSNDATLNNLIAAIRVLPRAYYRDDEWQVLEALLATLKLALANLQLVFTEKNEIDYPAIALGALQALGDNERPSDVALAMDQRLEHILVDEFQDTSKSQVELLRLLTAGWEDGDGRTLFLVGDPMQSIYRFREAEVGLFLDVAANGLGDLPIAPLQLNANFRSQAGIVEWVNTTFSSLFPNRSDIASGRIAYAASRATHPAAAPAVKIYAFTDQDGKGKEREAANLAGLAAELLADDPQDEVAILVRKRNDLAAVVPALAKRGLAFEAIEIASLARQPVVQDLLALTRALLHPADRAAWLAVLRAPWCGLDFESLERLAKAAGKKPIVAILAAKNAVPGLDEAATKRLKRVAEILINAYENRRRLPLRTAIESLWLHLGGPACVNTASALDDAAAFFALLENESPGGDLDDPVAFVERLANLYALPAAGSRLKVMTIHKAKGLEFAHVILPRLEAKEGQSDKRLLYWTERPRAGGGIDLLLGPLAPRGAEEKALQQWIEKIESEKQNHEALRLLYVATTRASKSLHLSAVLNTSDGNGENELKPPRAGSLLHILWPKLGPAFAAAAAGEEIIDAAPAANSAAGDQPAMDHRLAENWQLPPIPPAVDWQPPPPAVESELEVFHRAGFAARQIGILVHDYLRRIASDGIDRWPRARVEAMGREFERRLVAQGLDSKQSAAAAKKVKSALLNTLDDKVGRWLLGSHPVAYAEYALSGWLNGRLISRIIDRLFIAGDGTRWIVDYKTAQHEGGAVDEFIAAEVCRYRAQLSEYAVWLNRLEKRPTKCALYFPLLSRFVEIESAV